MRRISEYIFSILGIILYSISQVNGQDTLFIPLRVNVGIETIGPATYMIEKNTLSTEAYVSVDMSQKLSAAFAAGYLDYRFSQYNYTYLNSGFFIKAGADFNVLKPKKSLGVYWGGIGLRYGISRFNWKIPSITQTNYWGKSSSSVPLSADWGHFLEISPGMRAEIFRNFSMGWSINLRMKLYTGTPKDLRPVCFPGFGTGDKRFSTGFSYYIVWNFPYKKIRVITKKEEPEEEEDIEENTEDNLNRGERSGSSGFRQQSSGREPR